MVNGFNPGPRVRRIEFDDDTEFPGLWMRVGGLTFDEWLTLKIGIAVDLFAERLIEWNWVDDNGEPVPPTREGMGSLDAADVRTLVAAWSDRVTEVHRPPLHIVPPGQPDRDMEASMPTSQPLPAATN